MRLTPDQIRHVQKTHSLELPPWLVKRILYGKKPRSLKKIQRKTLDAVGFQLTNKFPQNIALMKNGDIVFCRDFFYPDGEDAPMISGFKFNKVIFPYEQAFLFV